MTKVAKLSYLPEVFQSYVVCFKESSIFHTTCEAGQWYLLADRKKLTRLVLAAIGLNRMSLC